MAVNDGGGADSPPSLPAEQHYSLKWNDYSVKLVTAFQSLRDEDDFVDVTVACDGRQYSAHKMVLSACSPYFRTVLRANPCQHPVVILKDVGHHEVERLLEFMYNGEVNIAQDQLSAFLKTAENLKIRGLAGSSDDMEQTCHREFGHSISSSGKSQNQQHLSSNNIRNNIGKDDSEVISLGSQCGSSRLECFSPVHKKRRLILDGGDRGRTAEDDSGLNGGSNDGSVGAMMAQTGSFSSIDVQCLARDLKAEPCDVTEPCQAGTMSDVYAGDGDHSQDHMMTSTPHLYSIGVGGSTNGGVDGGQQDLNSAGQHGNSDQGDVVALMSLSGPVPVAAPSERPIKCPLCQNIIKHARNLRRHVFKRHLTAAQRGGDITETDVKNVLERKLKSFTMTPLTEEELKEVQHRIRRLGVFKTPKKKKGVAALPAGLIQAANVIDETEVTIRKLPVGSKGEKRGLGTLVDETSITSICSSSTTNVLPISSNTVHDVGSTRDALHITELTRAEVFVPPRNDIIQEALSSRNVNTQDEVMDLVVTQEQQHLPSISLVVSQHSVSLPAQVMSHPVCQTVGSMHTRIPAEVVLQPGVRPQSDTTIQHHREILHPLAFDPQVAIHEGLAAAAVMAASVSYHNNSPAQIQPHTNSSGCDVAVAASSSSSLPLTSLSPASAMSTIPGYVPACYWSSPGTMPCVPPFQGHQAVFAPHSHHSSSDYLAATGMAVHLAGGRTPSLDRSSQQRRKQC